MLSSQAFRVGMRVRRKDGGVGGTITNIQNNSYGISEHPEWDMLPRWIEVKLDRPLPGGRNPAWFYPGELVAE